MASEFTYDELTKHLNVRPLSIWTALRFNILWLTGGNLFGIGDNIDFQINNNHDDDLTELLTLYSDMVQYIDNGNMFVNDALNPTEDTKIHLGATDLSDLETSVLTAFQNASGNIATRVISGYYTDPSAMLINRKLNLFGLPFLPWGALVLKGEDGKYHFKYINNNVWDKVEFNPLRKEVLMMKLKTIAILTGTSFVGYEILKRIWRNA